ncbi:MAG: leucine-rich repeat domain-containing protein [Muribaculaceae bacterium]|nr:leucine-rich repeat domain-containing protein [Muribaculaceae bacterium]
MKKLLYPQLALLLLATAACSSDDAPAVPQGDVTLVEAVPQNVDVVAPEQASIPNLEGFSGKMSYAGGQEITYQTLTYSGQRLAFITSIGGTASTVNIPTTLTLKNGDENVNFTVRGFNLNNYEGIGEGIETLRIPGTAARWFSSTAVMRYMTEDDFTQVINQSGDLKKIELGSNFANFCSINGAVYSEDMKTFVCCPRGREGEFVVANGVETIAPYAFTNCRNITRVVLPASIKLISDNAMDFTSSLLAIDILAPQAPKAGESAFGSFARDAQLRVAKGSRPTYFPEEFTAEAPEIPENVIELTAPTANARQNTVEAEAVFIKASNAYVAVAQQYAKALELYRDMIEFYNDSENFNNAGYVARLDKFVEAKSNYLSALTQYQIQMDDYKTLNADVNDETAIKDNTAIADAYSAALEASETAEADYNAVSRLYSDAQKIYKDRVATYEEELNDANAYKGYEFFNPANITEITFGVK